MAMDAAQVWGLIIPWISGFVYTILGGLACLGTWYYLFVYLRRKFWLVDVYETKSDGALHLVEKDRLNQKRINFGKQTIYLFKKSQCEAVPPPDECVRRFGRKEYCDYLRVLGEYIPMALQAKSLPNFHDPSIKKTITTLFSKHLKFIRHQTDDEVIKQKYIYIPLNKSLKYDIDYKPMPYDVNMMRVNQIDNIDQMFKDKQSFWDKYGQFIIIGAGIVMVIVIAWFGFEFAQNVVQQSLGAADKVSKPLDLIAEKLTGNAPLS